MYPFKIIECPKHEKIKGKILTAIDKTDKWQIAHRGDPDGQGPWTDWDRQTSIKKSEYMRLYLKQAGNLIFDTIRYDFGYEDADCTLFWYQQYEETWCHGWHFHPGCLYHAIYYVELPDGAPPTLCRMPGGFEFTPNAKEGDILIMPSIIEHTSPPNPVTERKTIIAMNIDR